MNAHEAHAENLRDALSAARAAWDAERARLVRERDEAREALATARMAARTLAAMAAEAAPRGRIYS